MIERKTIVINETGIHARPASVFVKTAQQFRSLVSIRNVTNDDTYVNAKSIMMVLTQEMCKGDEVEVKAEGIDEDMAVETLIGLIDSGFGEVSAEDPE